jgi:hypothetical protein
LSVDGNQQKINVLKYVFKYVDKYVF